MAIHNIKRYNLFLSLLIVFNTYSIKSESLSNNAVISTYQSQDGWTYLEYIFTIQPNHYFDCRVQQAQTIIATLGALFLSKTYANAIYKSNNVQTPTIASLVDSPSEALIVLANKELSSSKGNPKKESNFISPIISVLSMFTLGSATYQYFTCYTTKTINHKCLLSFVKNWNLHKEHIPSDFVILFDELHFLYKKYGEKIITDELVSEVFELVGHHLAHHFKDRYKQDAPKPETSISTLKTLTDIMKNIG